MKYKIKEISMATFTNQAQLRYNNTVVNSNITVGQIVGVLTATKTAVTPTYQRNDDITYVVSILNSGASPVTGVTVTDNLGAYTVGMNTVYPLEYKEGSLRVFVNGVLLDDEPDVTAGPPLVISCMTIPAGGNLMVIYEANVTEFASPEAGATISNTVTVEADNVTTPVTAEETVTAVTGSDATITKSMEPTVVTENGRLTYTFLIQNFGNAPIVATDDATVIDDFNPILSDITVTLNGVELSAPTGYTYNTSTGLFRTTPGVITVPAATYTQGTGGEWIITPGTAVLTVEGTI